MKRAPLVVLEALSVRGNPTGVAGGIVELAGALAERDRGLDFLVVTSLPSAFAGLQGRSGWRVLPFPAGGGHGTRAWFIQRRLPQLCREMGAQLLHSLQPVGPIRPSCPMVVTVHDLAWRVLPGSIEEPRRTYYRALIPLVMRRARLLLANSEATGEQIIRNFPALEDRVRIVRHGTPSWALAAGNDPVPSSAANPFFLFVGTLEPRKNLPRVLEAYERFAASTPDPVPELRLVGSPGWLMGPLRKRLECRGARGRVTINGYCSRADLQGLYQSALALVFPSLHEGFGLPVLEAMALGLPVLTANTGALAEIAGDGAVLVDPWDAADIERGMHLISGDDPLRARLIAGGRKRARDWTWSRTADLTAAAYLEALAAAPPRK